MSHAITLSASRSENPQKSTLSVAVIGSGISGLGAAWALSRRYDVSLFEQDRRVGGHTHTVTVNTDQGPVNVDTGFIVFNRRNYPNLSALFDYLGVATQPTDMSFSASIESRQSAAGVGRVEYAGDTLDKLYAQRTHILNPRFHRMVWDILRFNRAGKQLLAEPEGVTLTVGQLLARDRYSAAFRDHYLLPMAAAIWSCPTQAMLDFPAMSLLRFFENHGLLSLSGRPQWRTVVGGSRCYVDSMLSTLDRPPAAGAPVKAVRRQGDGVRLMFTDGREAAYDHVVISAHADQALAMLPDADVLEKHVLSAFRYQTNQAVLHTDASLMPVRRRLWSSWNYLAGEASPQRSGVSVTYWMNRLQKISHPTHFFVSLNPLQEPAEGTVIREITYQHPVFDRPAIAAQRQLHRLQGRGGVWFCGSYFGYGFHEDGLSSALDVARALDVLPPWEESRHPRSEQYRDTLQGAAS